MKKYEIHSSANYKTTGDSEEGDYYISYRWANSAAEAEDATRAELERLGFYNITVEAIEA